MRSEGEPGHWKQKALTLIGVGVFLLSLAINGGKLLQPDTVKKLQTPQVLTSGKETEYGLGWMVEEVTLAGESTRMVHYASRSLKGGTTSFMTFPARGMVVAVTANIANAITRDIALAIAQAFADNERR